MIHSAMCGECGGWGAVVSVPVGKFQSFLVCASCGDILVSVRHEEERLRTKIEDWILAEFKRDFPEWGTSVPELTWGPWIELELLNGWKPMPGFRPPSYRIREDGRCRLQGSAVGGEAGKPVFKLPAEIEFKPGRFREAWAGEHGLACDYLYEITEDGHYIYLSGGWQ